jgi:hypothetical protein
MTPRRSERAAAQRFYREMDGEAAPASGTATPTPNPFPQEPAPGRAQARPGWGGEKQDLMAQVRALYEGSAVPVREIARRAGVSERTLYKYARKNNWAPRYAWMPDGSRPPARPGRRRWSEAQEKHHARAEQFAPGQGAGGRFIRREDVGQPFAQGIKALDPVGRAAAVRASADAARAARLAQAKADAEAQLQKHLRIIENVSLACAEYSRFKSDRAGRGRGPLDDRIERLHVRLIETAVENWHRFVDREDLGIEAVERP